MSKVGNVLSKLYGVEVSTAFFESAENLQLLEKVANGSEKALKELGLAVSKDYFSNLKVEDLNSEVIAALDLEVN
jgi:hypothetical protein